MLLLFVIRYRDRAASYPEWLTGKHYR